MRCIKQVPEFFKADCGQGFLRATGHLVNQSVSYPIIADHVDAPSNSLSEAVKLPLAQRFHEQVLFFLGQPWALNDLVTKRDEAMDILSRIIHQSVQHHDGRVNKVLNY